MSDSDVSFTDNPVDARKIQGSIIKWQLEGSQVIDPPNVITPGQNVTTNKLYTWTNNEGKREWDSQGKAILNYDNGATIQWAGPNDGIITLTGLKDGVQAGEVSTWKSTSKG